MRIGNDLLIRYFYKEDLKLIKALVLLGPNLNLTGMRKTDIYGTLTQSQINEMISEHAKEIGMQCDFYQSNHEGDLIDRIHEAREKYDGIIFNAGAYTHYSYAIRDAIEAVYPLPVYEVHMSDIFSREDFRKISVITEVCAAQFAGEGVNSYLKAADRLADDVNG